MPDVLRERFAERYGHLYGEGALLAGGALEFELHSVVGTRALDAVPFDARELGDPDASAALTGERDAYFEPEGFQPTPVYDGHALRAGNAVAGPAIVQRMGDSVVVPPSYEALVDQYLTLRLAPTAGAGSPAVTTGVEVVR
jgi:N-methylhydantoinase A/oxoprolinase/acetone carboxylase beta subunit